ncbi:MAG: tripartite tricarboxylate transporter substrate binding protein [Rubrivivax sp.]
MIKRRTVIAAGTLLAASAARAQDRFPSKPLRLVVPYAAGGIGDTMARTLAVPLGELLGQTVIVDNRAGGDAAIGTEHVMRSAPDGYTLLQIVTAQAINAITKPNLRYDLLRDFEPVARIVRAPAVLLVAGASPYRSVADLLEAAKTRAGGLNFGSGATGSVGHLAGELFARIAKLRAMHVPYKGNALVIQDMVGGRIDFMFGTPVEAVANAKSGLLRALLVTSGARLAELPGVPTAAELGWRDFDASSFFGYMVPAGTPPAIVRQLQDAILKSLASPAMQERLRTLALAPDPGGADALRATVKADTARWAELIKAANIQVE